jgi:rubrerythrin
MNVQIKTEKNLQQAFSGESTANRRYTLYSEKAEEDGQPQVARLFRAAALAEAIHARNHFNAFDGIGSTKDNLTAAVLGEHEEFSYMYPGFIDDAERERNSRGLQTFQWANAVEKVHHRLFEKSLEAVREDKKPAETVYYVCQRCGNTVEGEAPDRCPICGAPRDRFTLVD